MKRFQALCLLLPLFLLAQTPQTASAFMAQATPTINWKSGHYIGRITIASYLKYYHPSNPTLERHDFEIRIMETTGEMDVNVLSNGVISSITFNANLPFSYKETMRAKDDKSKCCCLGYEATSSGRGKFQARTWAPRLMANLGSFTINNLKFTMTSFSKGGGYFEPKSKCPSELDTENIRSSLNLGFKSMFQSDMTFEVWSPTEKSMAGICSLPAWEVDADHVFVCSWYVERAPKKK